MTEAAEPADWEELNRLREEFEAADGKLEEVLRDLGAGKTTRSESARALRAAEHARKKYEAKLRSLVGGLDPK